MRKAGQLSAAKSERMTIASIYSLKKTALVESFTDGALILDLDNRHFFELNPTARDIIRLTNGRNKVADIIQLIVSEYQITHSQARQDIFDLYRQLIGQNILTLVTHHARTGE